MKIIADLHTHTSVSHHAYSSIAEMARGAKNNGMLALGMTNHGSEMPDGAHPWHFINMNVIPREIDGVKIIRGIEFNICPGGSVDNIKQDCLKWVEFALASFHEACFKPSSVAEHTEALEEILKNPLVNALGHSGNENFKFDYEHIISKCNEFGKIVEINDNSFEIRRGSKTNCAEIAKLCKQYSVPIVVNSDSHIEYTVGKFSNALAMLQQIDFPEELVINSSKERLDAYFKDRGISLF